MFSYISPPVQPLLFAFSRTTTTLTCQRYPWSVTVLSLVQYTDCSATLCDVSVLVQSQCHAVSTYCVYTMPRLRDLHTYTILPTAVSFSLSVCLSACLFACYSVQPYMHSRSLRATYLKVNTLTMSGPAELMTSLWKCNDALDACKLCHCQIQYQHQKKSKTKTSDEHKHCTMQRYDTTLRK